MNISWNVETVILITIILTSATGIVFISKKNWKRYGMLFFISGLIGILLCYTFVSLGFYSYPYR